MCTAPSVNLPQHSRSMSLLVVIATPRMISGRPVSLFSEVYHASRNLEAVYLECTVDGLMGWVWLICFTPQLPRGPSPGHEGFMQSYGTSPSPPLAVCPSAGARGID